MVHEEAPSKLCEAFRLFLQGMGYGKVLLQFDEFQKHIVNS